MKVRGFFENTATRAAYEQYQRAHILPGQQNSILFSSDFGLKTL